MRDDRLQGILFTRSLHLDLAPHNRRERFILKLQATRHYLNVKRINITEIANPAAGKKRRRADPNRVAELTDLLDRFKDRG